MSSFAVKIIDSIDILGQNKYLRIEGTLTKSSKDFINDFSALLKCNDTQDVSNSQKSAICNDRRKLMMQTKLKDVNFFGNPSK